MRGGEGSAGLARGVVRAASLLVPGWKRAEWREEWEAELDALASLRRASGAGYPSPLRFALGAVPHAWWTMREGWTADSVLQDVRYAVRVLRRAPGYTLVAALTLALGIGANASIFALVNGLLLRPPAGIREPDRLVQIARSYEDAPRWDVWSWPAFEAIRRDATTFSGVEGYSTSAFVVGRGADTEPVAGEYVSGNYFGLLGVRPQAGRLLQPSDNTAPGAHAVAVLSDGLWRRRFGGDPGIVGRTIEIGAQPYQVVGVAPASFRGIEALGNPPELWVPAMQSAPFRGRLPFQEWGWSWFSVFGRLRDGVSLQAARTSMAAVSRHLREAAPVNDRIQVLLAPGVGLSPQERTMGARVSWLLAAIAGLVLLLTCANVANLFLARANGRATEVSVRQALGAGRIRLLRQLVTESVVLAAIATGLAVPLVLGGARLLPSLFPYPLANPPHPDLRVYLFLAGVGVLAGLLFGATPAWLTARRDVARTLREGASTGGRGRTRLRDALMVGQLAVSLGLVSGAALLGRSILNAHTARPGFQPDHVLVGFLNLETTGRYDATTGTDFQERLLAELQRIPGVTAVAVANEAPMVGPHSRATATPADRADDPTAGYEAEEIIVSPAYFQTLGIPLVRGRTFRSPAQEPEPVVLVNQAAARLFWPGQDPLGRELAAEGENHWRVVGLVGDVQMRSLQAPARPAVYYPFHQSYMRWMSIQLRTRGAPLAMADALRRAVGAVDPELPVTGIGSLRDDVAGSLAETRTFGLLVTTFAALALVLSLIGLYGVVAHGVSQRRRELGIRLALGADRRELVQLVLGRGFRLAVVGAVLGLGVSWTIARALSGLLFGVSTTDPLTIVGAGMLLLTAALVAAWIPAWRASGIDAALTLRD